MAALPVSDDHHLRRAPVVTYLLIAINVVMYLVSPVSGLLDWYGAGNARGCAQELFIVHYAAIPRELLSGHQVALSSLPIDPRCLPHAHGFHKTPWLSALTSMFLHGSTMHLLGNMLFFVVFGPRIEERLGHARYLAAYVAFGYIAAYGYAVTSPSSLAPMLGASGAIAGVLGTYFVLNPRGRVIAIVTLPFIPFRLPAWVLLGSWFVLQWVSLRGDADSGTAYAAHLYGFVAGMLVGLALRLRGGAYAPGRLFAWR